MKLITCCSFKGGAGKTTSIMSLCSAWASNDKRVALFEADENRPLTRWKENAIKTDTWDDRCEVFIADDLTSWKRRIIGRRISGKTTPLPTPMVVPVN